MCGAGGLSARIEEFPGAVDAAATLHPRLSGQDEAWPYRGLNSARVNDFPGNPFSRFAGKKYD